TNTAREKKNLMNNIPVAYAVTYLIGTAFIVWFLPNVGPWLMRIDLKEESRKLQAQGAGRGEPERGVFSALPRFAVGAYRVTNERLLNRTVASIEALPVGQRVFVSRIRRDNAIIEPKPDTIILPGDVVAVMTRTELLMARGTEIGPELNDTELLDFPVEVLDVVVTNRAVAGKTLKELATLESSRGVFLRKVVR